MRSHHSFRWFLVTGASMPYTAGSSQAVRHEVQTDVVDCREEKRKTWCDNMQNSKQRRRHRTSLSAVDVSPVTGTDAPGYSARAAAQSPTPVLLAVFFTFGSMIRSISLALVCAVLFLSGIGGAAHAETSIGFVDIPYLIDKAPQAANAELRLETEFAPRQIELEEQRDQLDDLKARLKLEALELSDLDRGNLEREARGLERRLKRDELDFREELNIQKNNEFRKVRIMVLEAIARFGKANDFDLIVSDGVLYADKSIDVTEKILEQLDKANRTLQSSN